MRLTGNHRLRIVLVVVLLIAFSLPAALYGANLFGNNSLNHPTSTPRSINQPGFAGKAQLGIDCGYGSNEVIANATGTPGPDGTDSHGNALNPTFEACTWAGSPDIPFGGTQLQPLLSDTPAVAIGPNCCAAPSRGGGFTGEVVLIQNSTTVINGFDITVSWNTKILSAVEFDQGGLPFAGGNSFTPTSIIDNTAGSAELSQAILSPPAPTATISGNVTLFRIRFDVVGIGSTGLTISNDLVIDPNVTPNNLKYTLVQGSLVTSNIPDLIAGVPLGYSVSWTFTPNPEVPGSSLTFVATATCSGCTGALTYSWDTDSIQCYPDTASPCVPATIEATGSSATITAPTATLLAHRVTLIVTDGAGHVAQATRRLPLTVTPPPSSPVTTTASNTNVALTAKWLGGIPPYSGTTGQVGVKWTICNSTGLTQTICTVPSPSTTNTATQMNTITEQYKWQGGFTGTVVVTDTQEPQLPGPNQVTATFPVNVTGGTAPFAYTVAVTSNATAGATTAQVVSFTATVAYNTAYNSAARSTTFSYLFMFGDGQIATLPGTTGLVGTVTHKYAAAGTYPVVVIVQETGSNALAKIQEVGRFSQLITSPGNALCPAATPCTITFTPTNPMVGQTVTFTANVNGGVAPYTFSWSFGDGSALATGNPATHMYSAKGTFTVN